ncbi:HD family phosphohydrolase [Synergistales bacterium]|nr:HD family phosphohydrolase [Synergistales bacterium]
MEINKNEFIFAISFALDYLEMGKGINVSNHNKRVCLIATLTAKEMGMPEDDILDLYGYAMMHDNGITYKSYEALTEKGAIDFALDPSHCLVGEENLSHFPFGKKRENIIKYHHENCDGSGPFGLRGDAIPLFSRIINLSDDVEIMYHTIGDPKNIEARVNNLKGTHYDPDICDAFFAVSRNRSFWISLGDFFVGSELHQIVPPNITELSPEELLDVSCIISGIIDAKSPFTGYHSRGEARIAGFMSDYYGFDNEKKTKLIISANLHDLGKLTVPNSILDKDGKLTKEEFDVMKGHTFYTRKVLEKVGGLEDITDWAANHHEKLNGSGYPYGFSEHDLPFEAQLMSCVDIFQALTELRPYRKPLELDRVADIMNDMANAGQINGDIVNDLMNRFKDDKEALDPSTYM